MDEVVVTLFIAGPAQSTLPREMFAMIRDEMTPTILAGAGIFMLIAVAGLSFSQMLSRRS
jgi:putative spermidine/putrescine transport system permease protein